MRIIQDIIPPKNFLKISHPVKKTPVNLAVQKHSFIFQKIAAVVLITLLLAPLGFWPPIEYAQADGTTYYVDNTITDTNVASATPDCTNYNTTTYTCSGGSASAFATIADINAFSSLAAGDSVLFRKGQTWREQLTVPASGSSGSPITFGAYGSGNDPIINGANLITSGTSWTDASGADGVSGGELINKNFDDNDLTGWTITGSVVAANQRAEVTIDTSGGAGTDSAYSPSFSAKTELYVTYDIKLNSGWTWTANQSWQGKDAQNGAGLGMKNVGGVIKWMVYYRDDSGDQYVNQSIGPTDDTWHKIYIYWKAATGVGANNGIVKIYVDHTLLYSNTTIDSDTRTVTYDKIGNNYAGSGIQAIVYYDNLMVGTTGTETVAGVANTWSASVTTQPYVVSFDDIIGTNVASQSLVNSTREWYWASNVLYVYSTNDPDTAYTNPGIESGTRNNSVTMSSKNYITVTGLHSKYTNASGISVSGGQNAIISSNTVSGTYKGIIGRGQASSLTISNNVVSSTTQSGIWTYMDDTYSVSGLTISGNTITDSGHYGIDIYVIPAGSDLLIENNVVNGAGTAGSGYNGIGVNNDGTTYTGTGIIRYNLVYNVTTSGTSNGAGILADTDMDGLQIYGNISHDNYGEGIITWQSAGVKIYNNVVYNNGNTGSVTNRAGIGVGGIGGGDAIIKNNIFSSNYRNILVDSDVSITSIDINYNLYGDDGAAMFKWRGTDYTFANWKTNSSQDANSTSTDPLFTNVAGNDFTLQSTSPAINAGTNLGASYDDAIMPGSSWPSSITTADQDLRGSGWEIGAYVYPVPIAPTIGTPSARSISSIRWASTDNSDDETGFRVYDNNGNIATSSATAGLSYLDETGLSTNTQYAGRYVTAYNSYGNSASSSAASSIYTLAPSPTNLAGTAGQTTIDLSVDSFTNPTAGSSGYYFSRSGANSGWITTNSWSNSGLSCGTSYDYTVKYRNGDGTETDTISLTKSTNSCPGGGMPPDWWNPPKAPDGGFGVSINNGVQSTAIPTVVLNLKGGPDTSRMAISNFPDFHDSGLENYTSTSTRIWNLCWQNSILQTPSTCPAGTYTVYVKYYTPWGTASNVVSDTIVLTKGSSQQPAIPPSQITPQTQPSAPFTNYLSYLDRKADVKRLQMFLNQDPDTKLADSGWGSAGNETNFFGWLTLKAVIKFQEKYAKDILAPWNLTKGTGFVGKTTMAKINKLLGF